MCGSAEERLLGIHRGRKRPRSRHVTGIGSQSPNDKLPLIYCLEHQDVPLLYCTVGVIYILT